MRSYLNIQMQYQYKGLGGPHRAKISNFKSNDSQTPQIQSFVSEPLRFYDVICIENHKNYIIAMKTINKFTIGTIKSHEQKFNCAMGLFQILPINKSSEPLVLNQQRFCLKHNETGLYLSSKQESLTNFSNIIFQKDRNSNCQFMIENIAEGENQVYNQRYCKIKNVETNMYIRLQISDHDIKTQGNLWLSVHPDEFKIIIINKKLSLGDFLNNNDLLLIKQQKKLMGVIKLKNMFDYSDKKQQRYIIKTNENYFSDLHCEIEHFPDEQGNRSRFIISCLWKVTKVKIENSASYLIKNKEEVYLQHLETGLYLYMDQSYNFGLTEDRNRIVVENIERYQNEKSIKIKLDPIFIDHPVRMNGCSIIQHNLRLERVEGLHYTFLFISEILSFFENLIKTIKKPNTINEHREQLINQIKMYIFCYKMFQINIKEMIDEGFYVFEYTLKIIHFLKVLIKLYKGKQKIERFDILRQLLNPLIIQIIKFLAIMIEMNEGLQFISLQHKKIKEIIHTIFNLYNFHPKYTLNLMVLLSSIDPDIVLKLLAEKLSETELYIDKMPIIQTINKIIDLFRSINFDQSNLQSILQQNHSLYVEENSLCIRYNDENHQIFEIFTNILKIQQKQSRNNVNLKAYKEDEKYNEYLYLIEVIKILISNITSKLNELKSQINYESISKLIKSKHFLKKLTVQYLNNKNIQCQMIILKIIFELASQIYHEDFIIIDKLCYVIYNQEVMNNTTELSDVLKFESKDNLEWVFSEKEIKGIIDSLVMESWEKNIQLKIKLKYFASIIQYLTACIITCSYSIILMNKIEEFAIKMSTLYNDEIFPSQFFAQTREQLSLSVKISNDYIIEGTKSKLDDLLVKLKRIFQIIFIQKQRLFIYPEHQNPENIFQFQKFSRLYEKLLLNSKIRKGIPSIYNMLQFYQQQWSVTGIVLSNSQDNKISANIMQKIIQSIYCQTIILESIRLFAKSQEIKEKMIATVKQRTMNIQGCLNTLQKNNNFNQICQAYRISEHFFQFIIQNSEEYQLIQAIIKKFSEKIRHFGNIFQLIKKHSQNFFGMLTKIQNNTSSILILQWIGRQIQNNMQQIPTKQYAFIYEAVNLLIDNVENNYNLLYLINILKELGLHHSQQQQVLYFNLIKTETMQDFFKNSSSKRSIFNYLYKQINKFDLFTDLSIKITVVTRICKFNPNLMDHLTSILSYDLIFEIIKNNKYYNISKSLLALLITNPQIKQNEQIVKAYVLLVCGAISIYRQYIQKLPKDKSKGNHKQKSPCRTGLANKINVEKDVVYEQNYWQYISWVPFYKISQGILQFLAELMIILHEKHVKSSFAQKQLAQIEQNLKQLKADPLFKQQECKNLTRNINLIIYHVKYRRYTNKLSSNNTQKNMFNQQICKEIYKILLEGNILRPFIQEILNPLIRNQERAAKKLQKLEMQKQNQIKLCNNQQIFHVDITQNNTLRQSKIYHSSISPSNKRPYYNNRYFQDQTEKQFKIKLFFQKLKKLTKNNIEMYRQLQIMLMELFSMRLGLIFLHGQLNEEINNQRNMLIQFKNENVGYKCLRRKFQGQKAGNFSNKGGLNVNIQRLEIEYLKDLYSELQLDCFALFIKKIEQKIANKLIFIKKDEMQSLLDILLDMLVFRQDFDCQKQEKLLECMQIICEILMEQKEGIDNKKLIVQKRQHLFFYEFYNRFSPLQQHSHLFYSLISILIRLQSHFMKKISLFSSPLLQNILDSLPRNLYYSLIHKMITECINLGEQQSSKQQKKIYNNPNNVILTFMVDMLHKLKDIDYLSCNVSFYNQFNIVTAILNYLQIYVSHPFLYEEYYSKHFDPILRQYQINIYQRVFQRESSYSQQKKKLFQLTVIQLLNLFYTYHFYKKNALETKDFLLYYRLEHLLQGQIMNSQHIKQVYSYYESHFEYCLLKNANKDTVIQVYPANKNNNIEWKDEFIRILKNYGEINDKKDILFSYSQNVSQGIFREHPFQNICHLYQTKIIFTMTLLLVAFLYDRLSSTDQQDYNYVSYLFLSAHLILLVIIILQKYFILSKIGRLQVLLNKSKNKPKYYMYNHIPIVIFCLLMVFINLFSFQKPTIVSLLIFIHLISRNTPFQRIVKILHFSAKFFIINAILVFCIDFFIILSLSNTSDNKVFPDLATYYNIDMKWSYGLQHDVQIYVKIVTNYLSVVISTSGLIVSMINCIETKSKSVQCQLCSFKNLQKKITNQSLRFHMNFEHNVFRLISCFVYLLKKDERYLSKQEKKIKQMILAKNYNLF